MSLDAKLREARDQAEKLRAMRADMQPEVFQAWEGERLRETAARVGAARVADLPALWRSFCRTGYAVEATAYERAGRDLEFALSREPHISITADALKTLAGSRDLEKRCAQLQREVDGYRRALSSIIAVHMLEAP